MKNAILLALSLISGNLFAFDSITTQADLMLKYNQERRLLIAELHGSTTNDYCVLSIKSQDNIPQLLVKKGSVFKVSNTIQNRCGRDWGKQCRLDLEAENVELGLDLDLMCKDRGVFAQELTPSKVNKLLKGQVIVR